MTAVCWSVTRQVRTHGTAALHLQGYIYDKPDRTLCGRKYYSGELYDFDVIDKQPHEIGDVLCKQCRAAHERLARGH